MPMNKKFRQLLQMIGCLIGTTVIVWGASQMNANSMLFTKGDVTTYHMSLKDSEKVTATEIGDAYFVRDTELGNEIEFMFTNVSVSTSGFIDLEVGGELYNMDPLNTLTTLDVTTSSAGAASYRLYYGATTFDCNFFLEKEFDAAHANQKVTFTLDFAANFFCLVNTGTSTLTLDRVDTCFTCIAGNELATEFAVANKHQYFTNAEIAVPVAKVMLGTEKLDTVAVVKDPDGLMVTGNPITLEKAGNYSVTYTATKGLSRYEKTVTFESTGTVNFISSPTPGAVKSITPGATDGLVFDLNPDEMIYFNEIVDVSGATFAGTYILLSPGMNPVQQATFKVILRDVVDPTNYIEVVLITSPGDGRISVWAHTSGSPLGSGVDNVFSPKVNLIFDYAAKQFGVGDKSTILNLDPTWTGFTDGKAIMTLECADVESGPGKFFADYAFDTRGHVVTGQPSYRSGKDFHLMKDSTYKLTGYTVNVPTTDCSFFLYRMVFKSENINATLKVKIIDTADENNFIYLVYESLSDKRIRFSLSANGNPDLANLMQTGRYMTAGHNLNTIWDGASHWIRSTDINQAAYGGVANAPLGAFNPVTVKLEFTCDQNITFELDYFGDVANWL